MTFYRIGEKLISLDKIGRQAEKIIKLRAQGLSQQEISHRFGLDRSFISRLESLGEVRKGRTLAVVGFPIENKIEIEKISREAGVDFVFLMNNRERWELVQQGSGMDFVNKVMQLLSRLRSFDAVIIICSEKWLNLAEALLDCEVHYISLGPSPIADDCILDPCRYRIFLEGLLAGT